VLELQTHVGQLGCLHRHLRRLHLHLQLLEVHLMRLRRHLRVDRHQLELRAHHLQLGGQRPDRLRVHHAAQDAAGRSGAGGARVEPLLLDPLPLLLQPLPVAGGLVLLLLGERRPGAGRRQRRRRRESRDHRRHAPHGSHLLTCRR
jgi:hypothetical protein